MERMLKKVDDIAKNEQLTNNKVTKIEGEMKSLIQRVQSMEKQFGLINMKINKIDSDVSGVIYGWSYLGPTSSSSVLFS